MNDAAGGGSTVGGPCGACKFLRRKCVPGCVFAPYFDSEQGAAHFSAVHKVFGASNASKLLLHIPAHRRHDAVVTMCYEAQARLRDPVYGCVSHIFALQQQVVKLQAELSYLQAHLATLQLPQPPPQPPALIISPPPISAADIPVISSLPATYDLSLILDPTVQASSSSWAMHRRTFLDHSRWQFGTGSSSGESGDLHALAHELLQRQGSPAPPTTGGSPLRSLSR